MAKTQQKGHSEKALIAAASDGQIDELERLVQREGVDPNTLVEYDHQASNKTLAPLSAAASAGQIEIIVKLIKDYEADIEIKDSSSRTPLLIAAQYGQSEALKILIEAEADLAAVDADGKSALHYAVLSGDIHAVQVLLAAGIDYLAEDKNGNTAFDFAAKKTEEEFENAPKRKEVGRYHRILVFIAEKMQQQLREIFANRGQKSTELIVENDKLKAENADLKQRLQHPQTADEKWAEIAGEAESPTIFKGEEENEDDGKGAMESVAGSPAFVHKM